MVKKEVITQQYNAEKAFFDKAAVEMQETLSRVAGIYYEQTRLKVFIPALRVKSLASILGKLERKGRSAESLYHTDDNGNMSLVTNDFIGGRILCNTNEDVKAIVKIIEDYQRFNVIKKDELSKESGYKAVHIDLSYSTFHKDSPVEIPLELQIKTFFQHAWAEVTHDDTYKPTDDDQPQSIPTEEYYRNIASVLEGLDGFLSTIRKQKLSYIAPPSVLEDSDTIINAKTLSFKIDEWKKNTQFTNQEMTIVINRLREEGFVTLQDINTLFEDEKTLELIKSKKVELKNNANVSAFDLLIYGPLIRNGKIEQADEEIKLNLGFVTHKCIECNSYLTEDEYDFILNKTDSDFDYYCEKHRYLHFTHECNNCGKYTTSEICVDCEAATDEPNI